MDLAILLTGFGTLAGLLAGYLTARKGRLMHVCGLWAITALAVLLYPIWLDRGGGAGAPGWAALFYFVLVPFGLGVLAGSFSGALMRAVFARRNRT